MVLAVCLSISGMEVYAAQGTVTFGSESYNWYTERVCPLGVYVNGDEPIGSYEVYLEYDETMLRYLDGATGVEGNRIYISGTGEALSYKTMLHFEPLQEGNTAVTVLSATCTTIGDVSTGNTSQAVEMTELSLAPIAVHKSISNRLQTILIDGKPMEIFAPEVFEYFVSVDAETENLVLDYSLVDEEARVTVSDTSLQVGTNTLTISIKGTAAEDAVYTLHVTRPEPEPVSTEPEESLPGNDVSQGDLSEDAQQGEIRPEDDNAELPVMSDLPDGTEPLREKSAAEKLVDKFLENPILWCATILTAVLVLAYFIDFLGKRKQKTIIHEEDVSDIEIINLEQTVIDIQHVTMLFKLAQDEASSLKEYMIRAMKGQNHYQYLTALDDVSFEVKQGDVVGIIGTNGSGKSTLLKIVSGALKPTDGYVDVNRSKVQMLTLGTGFDMELTARENVYLNGAIIGYSKEYIDEKYDEIVEFAELEGFMEERMKNFSSGMVSRLGFAIATMRDTPDILILDEVLSVGDMFFREKSMERIKQMIHGGSTVLIVSHSPDVIIKNCNRAVWIEKGVLQMVGDPQEVCEAYKNYEIQAW